MKRYHRKILNIPGHAHELTFSCYQNYKLLKSDRTCLWLIESIDKARIKHDFSLLAYVVMPDHVHIILHPNKPDYDVSAVSRDIKLFVSRRAMRYLENNSSQWLERLTRKRGKRTERVFWQSGGGYDRNIDKPETLEKMIDYIHRNPVRKGLVDKTVDWYWSSASWYAGVSDEPIGIDPIEI